MKNLALILGLTFLSAPSHASDHIDGPVTQNHRVADLSDFYTFPTPNKPGSLSLILNTYPLVPGKGHFTDKATYVFLLRKANIRSGTPGFNTSDEVVINCKFVTPYSHAKHTVTCRTTNGLEATSKYDVKGASTGDFKLFSGMVSDPFFFWADFASAAANDGVIKAPKNDNTMSMVNCLTIAIEIDLAKLFPTAQPNLIAAAAAVVTRDSKDAPLRILDRIGRPEVTNVSLFTKKGDTELRDLYNAERPFSLEPKKTAAFEERLIRNITHYDSLDKKTNWAATDKAAFSKLFVEDFLVVDPTKPCGSDGFLEIEKSLLVGKQHSTCGGRKPTDDIMDTLFSIYIGGLEGPRIRDGVDAPYRAISNNFPHLAAPDMSLQARAKAKIARLALGLKD